MQPSSRGRLYLWISLIALCVTALWSVLIYLSESRHAGEPLPVLTFAQLAARPEDPPEYVHVQGGTPDFSKGMTEDHLCNRDECKDYFTPLSDTASSESQRTAVLMRVRIFPRDSDAAQQLSDLHDPVIEGSVLPDRLTPGQLYDLRARGIVADEQTVVFERAALHGRVPLIDSVDVLSPWLVGLPLILFMGAFGFAQGRRREPQF